jgi:hypothetical protein
MKRYGKQKDNPGKEGQQPAIDVRHHLVRVGHQPHQRAEGRDDHLIPTSRGRRQIFNGQQMLAHENPQHNHNEHHTDVRYVLSGAMRSHQQLAVLAVQHVPLQHVCTDGHRPI